MELQPELLPFLQALSNNQLMGAQEQIANVEHQQRMLEDAAAKAGRLVATMKQMFSLAVADTEPDEEEGADGAPVQLGTVLRENVLELARQSALSNPDRLVNLESFVPDIVARFRLASKKPGTTIGNILFRSPRFRQVSPGIYQLIGA